jgi:isopenicillin N synthase-like dioxygenase
LNAGKLIQNDKLEVDRLLLACKTYGFFYLDLSAEETSYLTQDWEDVLAFMNWYFDQPLDVKLKDSRNSDTHGYKPLVIICYLSIANNGKLRTLWYICWGGRKLLGSL